MEKEVRMRSGQRSVIDKLRTYRWRYYIHALIMCEERLPKQVLSWTSDGSRHRGRPNYTWRRTIQRDLSTRGPVAGDVEHVVWRRED